MTPFISEMSFDLQDRNLGSGFIEKIPVFIHYTVQFENFSVSSGRAYFEDYNKEVLIQEAIELIRSAL